MRQSVAWFVASRLGARRILRQIRARIARWSREDKSRSRRQTTHPEWHTLRHGKATCLPWRILYQLYASQIDAATNNVAFSCGFARFLSHHVSVAKRLGNAVSFSVSAEGPAVGISSKYLQEPIFLSILCLSASLREKEFAPYCRF